jgi:transcription elongation factor GreB
MIGKIEVVDPGSQREDQIRFGARVRVRDSEEREMLYTIVGVDESVPAEGRISWISPVARALLSKRVGDTARLRLPDGEKVLKITAVEYG